MATRCVARVPDRYLDKDDTGNTDFIFPMYNQDYSITYKFSNTAFKNINMVDLLWPDYDISDSSVLFTERVYNFNCDEAEKTIMENFLKAFNNSFQPFRLTITVDETSQSDVLSCILNGNPTFNKDVFDRWTISLSLLEAASITVQYS